jgi:hypothetical protein
LCSGSSSARASIACVPSSVMRMVVYDSPLCTTRWLPVCTSPGTWLSDSIGEIEAAKELHLSPQCVLKVSGKTFVFLLTLDRESTDRCFLYAYYENPKHTAVPHRNAPRLTLVPKHPFRQNYSSNIFKGLAKQATELGLHCSYPVTGPVRETQQKSGTAPLTRRDACPSSAHGVVLWVRVHTGLDTGYPPPANSTTTARASAR